MPLSLVIGHKIDISTQISAQWHAHPVPQTHAVRSEILALAASNIVDLRSYTRKRVYPQPLVKSGEA